MNSVSLQEVDRSMKTSLKIIAAVFGLGTVILLGMQLFLQIGLTKAMREAVLPRIQEQTGIDVRVARLSVNVAHGRLTLKGVAIRNPEGFSLANAATADRVMMDLDLSSLWKVKPLNVNNFTVQGATVNLIRNPDGLINLHEMQKHLSTQNESRNAKPSDQTAMSLPGWRIENLYCRGQVRYLDLTMYPLDISLDVEVSGQRVGAGNDPSAEWGILSISGSLSEDQTQFLTDLQLKLAPINDPVQPSFDLAGTIMEIDPHLIGELYDRIGMHSAPFMLKPRIHCAGGIFEESFCELGLRDIVVKDKLANELGGMTTIRLLQFPVSISGTLQDPVFNVEDTLLKALKGNTGALPESLGAAAVEASVRPGERAAVKKDLKDLADG